MLFAKFLDPLVRSGRLTVIDAGGLAHEFGAGDRPAVTIRLHDRSLHWKLFVRPDFYAGEAYMDGSLTVEDGSIYDFLDLIGRNVAAGGRDPFRKGVNRMYRLFRGLQQFNPIGRSRRNVAHHYDLSGALFDTFLDSDRQYSCAYFLSPRDTLDEAQVQKCRHIAAKLLLRPGMSVLDIGSGWGGLSLYMADRLGAKVTGITLSEEQLNVARARAADRRLGGQVQFALRDYRQETDTYDRIVSVGMFEHVGQRHYDRFFACLRDRLADDGVALLHTIGRPDGPGVTNAWIRKHIFPGAYTPALSEVTRAIERAGLWITDIEVLRLHYAETLRHWRGRFLARLDRVLDLYDARFCRMWEFYLAGCEVTFRYLNQAVYQFQITKRVDAVPIVRSYMDEVERALSAAEEEPMRHSSGRAA